MCSNFRCAVGIFFARAFCHGFLYFVLVAQVEVLQAQCGEVRPNGFRRLALLIKLQHDEVKRNTARRHIESPVSALNEFPIAILAFRLSGQARRPVQRELRSRKAD